MCDALIEEPNYSVTFKLALEKIETRREEVKEVEQEFSKIPIFQVGPRYS